MIEVVCHWNIPNHIALSVEGVVSGKSLVTKLTKEDTRDAKAKDAVEYVNVKESSNNNLKKVGEEEEKDENGREKEHLSLISSRFRGLTSFFFSGLTSAPF